MSVTGLKSEHLERPVNLYVCKDGTVSIAAPDEDMPIPAALPFFSTETREEAESLRVMMCDLSPDEHPDMPGKPWYFRAAFPGTLEAIGELAEVATQRYDLIR